MHDQFLSSLELPRCLSGKLHAGILSLFGVFDAVMQFRARVEGGNEFMSPYATKTGMINL